MRGHAATRVAVGSGLLGGGIAALAFVPSDNVGWLVVPECVAGFGMGLALTPLIEELLPERTYDARALNLAVRHLGITLALVALAPVIHHDLDAAIERAKLQSVGVVLVAPIGPREKISLAPKLVAAVHTSRPLAGVRAGASSARATVKPAERPRFDVMFHRIEETFVAAARDAFANAFLIAAALAFAAAALLVVDARRAAIAGIAAGACVVGAQALVNHFAAPEDLRARRAVPVPRASALGRRRRPDAGPRAEGSGRRGVPSRRDARGARPRARRQIRGETLRAEARRQPELDRRDPAAPDGWLARSPGCVARAAASGLTTMRGHKGGGIIDTKGVVSMKSRYGFATAVAMLSIALFALGSAPAAAKHGPSAPTVVTSFGFPEFAESLAADRYGNLYAAVTNWDTESGQVVRISTLGVQSAYGDALEEGMVTGLAFDGKGNLYIGFASFSPETPQGVFRVEPEGPPTQILSLGWESFPNGLAFHAGYLYVSDSTLGAVWRVRPGHEVPPVEPWLQDPLLAPTTQLGANGLAFRGNDLYVAVWDAGRIVRVPVKGHGAPGDATVVPGGEQAALAEVDGIAFDVRGNLYATTNTNGVLRLAPDGTLESLVDASWLDYPTMPVFGTAPDARTMLYVANGSFDYASPNVIAFDVGVHGLELP